MKERIKKFVQDNKERLLFVTGGVVVGAAAVAIIARDVMHGREVASVWTDVDKITEEKVGYSVLLNNGKYVPYHIPIPVEE